MLVFLTHYPGPPSQTKVYYIFLPKLKSTAISTVELTLGIYYKTKITTLLIFSVDINNRQWYNVVVKSCDGITVIVKHSERQRVV